MSVTTIQALVDVATVLISVIGSAFASGISRGAVKTDIAYIKRDLETIKSMFVLTIRSSEQLKDGR